MAEAYQVIARRWRPKQFDELVGQEHIVRTLKNAIDSNRIAHAYLFVGPRGTGKTTTARIFAKALNAEGGPSATPDDTSDISKAIMDGSCMDVIEIDGASNNGVDQIRDLRQECQYSPAQGTYKIYIIDEVHMLSNQAWNALLKTLEEPPSHVKFIFATTEAHKVLPTVVSRCQRFEFRPIPDDKIAGKLGEIAKAESIDITPGALTTIARMADGGMRDAQSILDQLISFCGNKITDENVLDVYGLASEDDLKALTEAMAAAAHQPLFAAIERLASEGRDLYRLLLDIQRIVRQALLEAITGGGQTDMLGTPLTAESLTRMLDALQSAEHTVRQGLSQRVNFEVALLRAIDQSRSRAIDSLIKELSQLAAGLPEDAGQKKISPSLAPEKKVPAREKAPAVPGGRGETGPAAKPSADVGTAKSQSRPAQTPPPIVLPDAGSGASAPAGDGGVNAASKTSPDTPKGAGQGATASAASKKNREQAAPLPPIVLPGDDVPLEVLEAAAASAGEESGYSFDVEGDYSVPGVTEGMEFPGSKRFEAARESISPATLELLDERLRAVPKFLKKVPRPQKPEGQAAAAGALPEAEEIPVEEDELDES
ncbi:DNA polymerase III subunit gamma/tau [Ruficoccus amylovorans]|uniref:DNA polymerase III subunit gamma/tau n=1 Tax=Ruficoccus amylovorans TaxID=1804625 RepID=A0A842H9R2_9BACT|nr:DNA polymerase III subunit gamma/tau [Ruficoccus amylovorans]MBC2593152.1 DNA polymerase III subunit gamma/tau [Ruficoccus amylovorans]